MRGVKTAEPIFTCLQTRERDPNLQLYVIFTELKATRAALETACDLARDLNARVVMLVAQVVPFPRPLDEPEVARAFHENALAQLAGGLDADVTVRVSLCRDRDETLRDALPPRSVVVIGRGKRWRPNRAAALARLLKREGHEVILAGVRRIQPARLAI